MEPHIELAHVIARQLLAAPYARTKNPRHYARCCWNVSGPAWKIDPRFYESYAREVETVVNKALGAR